MDDEKIAEATAALKVLGYTGKEIEKALKIKEAYYADKQSSNS